jgi:hypothetical protein
MEITAREASLTRIFNLMESIKTAIGSIATMEEYTLNTLYRTESLLNAFDRDLWSLVDYGEVTSEEEYYVKP